MKKTFLLTIGLVFFCQLLAQGQPLEWTTFEHLEDSLRAEKRPLMIFIHTDWCRYCSMQEHTTFQDAELVRLLRQRFYCLRLDAETRKEVFFINRMYRFRASGGYHELAELLGRQEGALLFPTTVLIGEDLQFRMRLRGLQRAEDLLAIMEGF